MQTRPNTQYLQNNILYIFMSLDRFGAEKNDTGMKSGEQCRGTKWDIVNP